MAQTSTIPTKQEIDEIVNHHSFPKFPRERFENFHDRVYKVGNEIRLNFKSENKKMFQIGNAKPYWGDCQSCDMYYYFYWSYPKLDFNKTLIVGTRFF